MRIGLTRFAFSPEAGPVPLSCALDRGHHFESSTQQMRYVPLFALASEQPSPQGTHCSTQSRHPVTLIAYTADNASRLARGKATNGW